MQRFIDKAITYSFYLLFLLVPLVLFPKTSEIFEFNKLTLTYGATVFITGLWALKIVFRRKIIFRRTQLDIPLILFISAMGISTLFSIDPRTSLLGYYSRFNGGLISLVAYSLLYWAYVSNMNASNTKAVFKVLFASTLISSVWGVLEHFGHSFSCLIFPDFKVFDNSCWVQDVQNRVYSTFGQPNWLAAWLTALIPITWAFALNSNLQFTIYKQVPSSKIKFSNLKNPYIQYTIYNILSAVFFITLLFTKSRSGILAFVISFIIFWSFALYSYRKGLKKIVPNFLFVICNLSFVIFLVGTPWTSSFFKPSTHLTAQAGNSQLTTTSPALETGGTESGTIRKIVWRGAFEIWQHNPIFGTGPETFAYSYYNYRPVEHNLTSEWDYLYNKAHNEYLNYMATTGTIGTVAYLVLIVFSLLQISNFKFQISKQIPNFKIKNSKISHSLDQLEIRSTNIALLAGYTSILVTNFFGFSTVPINLLFFLLPALAVTLHESTNDDYLDKRKLSKYLNTLILVILLLTAYFLFLICRYWSDDYTYAYGKRLNDSGNYDEASKALDNLVNKNLHEPNYWDELSSSHANLAVYNSEQNNSVLAKQFADKSYVELKEAIELSPANVTLKRKAATRLIGLTAIDNSYLGLAKTVLQDAVKLAPTDAKLRYNLGLTYLRTGDIERAVEVINETVNIKPDYELAHYALGLIYIDQGKKEEAKAEFKYILEKINPNNINVQRELNELN